jgi:hypothetical protein
MNTQQETDPFDTPNDYDVRLLANVLYLGEASAVFILVLGFAGVLR